MNLEDRINRILTNRDWGLIDQADRFAWQEFINDVAALIEQPNNAPSVDQERLNRAVIGAYCLILHAACSDEGSQRQQRAFEELWRWVYPRVRRRVDTDQDAEDVAQQVMLQVYPNLHQVTDPRGFLAWVNTITYHTLSKHYDRQDRRSPLESDSIDAWEDSETMDALAGPDDFLEVELAIAQKEIERMIYECMPEDQRRRAEVFVARVLEGLTVEETAQKLRTTPSGVYGLYFHAKNNLPTLCPEVMEALFEYFTSSQQAKQRGANS